MYDPDQDDYDIDEMEGRWDARPARAADDRPPAWIRDEFGDKITDGSASDDGPAKDGSE